MQEAALRRLEMKGRLQRAVDRGEIEIFYQPVIALATGAIHGAEALVRWQQPGQRRLGPLEFIPLAEETGLIHTVGRHVLTQACHTAQEWTERFSSVAPLRMAVNKLAQTFRLKVVAEGIERPEQVERLRQMRCHLGQGFLFSAPVPADRFEALLEAAGGEPKATLIDFAQAAKTLTERSVSA